VDHSGVEVDVGPRESGVRVPEIRSWLVTWGFAVARSGVEAHAFEPGSCHNRAVEATRKLRKASEMWVSRCSCLGTESDHRLPDVIVDGDVKR